MIQKIKDHFIGLLHFQEDEKWIVYPYGVSNHKMTAFSIGAAEGHLTTIKPDDWLFGIDEDNYNMAFLCNNASPSFSLRGTLEKYSFSTPVIVKSRHNGSYEDLKLFDGLYFWGGALNFLYPPQKAYYVDEKSDSIQFRPKEKYFRSFSAMLKGCPVKVTFSIDIESAKSLRLTSNRFNDVNSFVCLQFDNPRPLKELTYYHNLVQNIASFCVGQKNTGIQTQILKKDDYGIAPSAFCKFNYGYDEPVRKDLMSVVRIDSLSDDNLASLFQLFDDNGKSPYLEVLPSNNHETRFIDSWDICMLCTTLEREFVNHGFALDKDDILAEFQKHLLDIVEQVRRDMVGLNSRYVDSIRYNINNLSSPSEKSRIIILYERYTDYMKPICEKWFNTFDNEDSSIPKVKEPLNRIYTPEEFSTAIKRFVELRNEITHKGIVEWRDRAKVFSHLYLILCFSVFERAGVSPPEAAGALSFLFSKDFWD